MATTEKTITGTAKTREGIVVSDKMQKTVVVAVRRSVQVAKYAKYVRRTSKYMAHDEKGSCKVGDLVRISETRPRSRQKRWTVVKILAKAE